MPRDGPIKTVLVVGGGVVGWSAAAAIKRRVAGLDVTILPLTPPENALADRITSTLPSALEFHADIGVGEGDAVLRAGGGYRLGSRFGGWGSEDSDYIHCYGRYGRPFGATSFHLHWLRFLRERGSAPFDRYSTAAMLARENRIPVPVLDAPPNDWQPGLVLDPPRYVSMLRAFCAHIGVVEQPAGALRVRLDPADGFVEALTTEQGVDLVADLFVDCSGPRALVRGAIDSDWQDWSRWLPCDRIQFAAGEATGEWSLVDEAATTGAGWRWTAAGPKGARQGIAYSAAHVSDANAARQLAAASGASPGDPIVITPGTRAEPWQRNCVAVGDAATTSEPLEWTGLHLAHSAIDRLIAMLPARDCAPIELAEYNRQTLAEAERVRDFVALHYAVSGRREPFWRERAAVAPPDSLAHTLALFRERGRLPVYEEETFSRDSWLAVLLGQGVWPRRTDPLVEAVPAPQAAQAMGDLRSAIAAGITSASTHAAFIAAQRKRLIR